RWRRRACLWGHGSRFYRHGRWIWMPQNPALQGDFTVEDDSPATALKPAVQGRFSLVPQGVSPLPGVNPSGPGTAVILPEGTPVGQESNNNLPSPGGEPAAQSRGSSGATPAAATPEVTQALSDSFMPFGGESTLPLDVQQGAAVDPTLPPDAQHMLVAGNEANSSYKMPGISKSPECIEETHHFCSDSVHVFTIPDALAKRSTVCFYG
ncbi:unnamed protein product, partial [Caretta caretta]